MPSVLDSPSDRPPRAGRRRRQLLAVPALAAALVLTGCGGGGGGGSAAASALASAGDAVARALQSVTGNDKADDGGTPSAKVAQLTVRAWGSLAGNVGPRMAVRVDGVTVGEVEVRATAPADFTFAAPGLTAGSQVDVVFLNDEMVGTEDRNLFVAHVSDGNQFVAPSEPGVVYDAGAGAAAFDGLNTLAGQEGLWFAGALRIRWPAADRFAVGARDAETARFLQQATFGPTLVDVARLRTQSFAAWIDEQVALPVETDGYVRHVQAKFDQGPEFLPYTGAKYDPDWVGQRFWTGAATGSDQLRRRMAFALHKLFVVSQADANLYWHARAYAAYLDVLHRGALGNYRTLLEDVALSPAMGIYLSHMRNLKEDPATNRLPDENFARELMQLFTIGLHELNNDGTPKLDAQGQPIETYGNADVMALAKVFTGWSWGYDDAQLTEANFRWGTPDAKTTALSRVDIRRMKAYPQMASTAEKRLFTGKPHALVIPANTPPADAVRLALDTLFRHPNVGPFVARQLIQQLVTSNPSPAYVARVADAFNDNGRGVRGDLAAVVRAVLLDAEARSLSTASTYGKLREPVLRVTQWMRAFGARSLSGEFRITNELEGTGQTVNRMPSVFGFFRPGYAPPEGALATAGLGAPEMQITNESTLAAWANRLEVMVREGVGWVGTSPDITVSHEAEAALVATAPQALLSRLDLLLFAGTMSPDMKRSLMDAMQGVPDWMASRDTARAKVATFVAMSSPEYLVQR